MFEVKGFLKFKVKILNKTPSSSPSVLIADDEVVHRHLFKAAKNLPTMTQRASNDAVVVCKLA